MNSHCFQAQAEDFLDQGCLDGGQSVMLNGMNTASRLFPGESVTDSLMTPLFMAISAHSLIRDVPSFTEGLRTSYQPDSPVSHFPLPESDRGGADERNMWPATKEVIRIVRPRYAFLENVPGLLGAANGDSGEWNLDNDPTDNLRYFGTILADLAEIGFDARWTVLGADDIGAPHRRKRLWVLAYSVGIGSRAWRAECKGQQRRLTSISTSNVADTPQRQDHQ